MKTPTPRQASRISLGMLLSGALIGGLGATANSMPLAVFGIVLLVGSILFRLVFYRCPHCGKYLDRSGGPYCPYCGKSIDPQ